MIKIFHSQKVHGIFFKSDLKEEIQIVSMLSTSYYLYCPQWSKSCFVLKNLYADTLKFYTIGDFLVISFILLSTW